MRLRPGVILIAAFSVFLLVLYGGKTALVFLLFLILLALLGFVLTWRAFQKLCLERKVKPTRVSCGETAQIELIVENRSSMPLVWVEIWDDFQPYMVPQGGAPRFALSLKPHEKKTITYRALLNKRGEYALRPLIVSAGDPWDLWRREKEFPAPASLIVFPRVLPISEIRLPLKKPFEGKRSGIRAYEDYTAISGLRDYLPIDPLKRIHWKVSAHAGKMLVKEFEFSASTTLAVWLDLVSTGHGKEFMEIYEEYASMIAASILYHASDEHIPALLQVFPSKRKEASLGKGKEHFLRQMEVLARARSREGDLYECIREAALRLPWQCNLVLISSVLNRQFISKLVELRLRSRHLSLYLLYEGSFLLPGEKPRLSFMLDPLEVSELRKMSGMLEEQNIRVRLVGGNMPLETVS